jgi:hypothetical protein
MSSWVAERGLRCILLASLASLASCVCGLHSEVTTHSCLIGSLEASSRWVDAWKLVEGTIYAFIPIIRIVFPWTPAQCRTTGANTVLSKVIYKNSYTNTINAPCLFYTSSTQF